MRNLFIGALIVTIVGWAAGLSFKVYQLNVAYNARFQYKEMGDSIKMLEEIVTARANTRCAYTDGCTSLQLWAGLLIPYERLEWKLLMGEYGNPPVRKYVKTGNSLAVCALLSPPCEEKEFQMSEMKKAIPENWFNPNNLRYLVNEANEAWEQAKKDNPEKFKKKEEKPG